MISNKILVNSLFKFWQYFFVSSTPKLNPF
jgi:hypothetical protein